MNRINKMNIRHTAHRLHPVQGEQWSCSVSAIIDDRRELQAMSFSYSTVGHPGRSRCSTVRS